MVAQKYCPAEPHLDSRARSPSSSRILQQLDARVEDRAVEQQPNPDEG